MDRKQKSILIELMNHEFVSGQDLAAYIQMRTRSVRTIIKNIIQDIKGARIESGSFGYRLVIEDSAMFLQYLQQEKTFEDSQSRFQYIFNRFIENNDYIKVDDLCEELYLSKTQLKQILKEVREYFQEHEIEMKTKTHYGMYLEGTELNKRKAIAYFYDYERDLVLWKQIKNIVLSSIANVDYVISDDVLDNLVSYLYIAYIRVQKQYYANIDEQWEQEIKEEKEYSLACSIMSLMNSILNMEYRQEEIAYLTIHLCGKNCKQNTYMCINEDILYIVENMLQKLEDESHVPFTSDLNLQLALSLHMIPLLKRIHYSTYMHNPLVLDIKRKLMRAYDLSVIISQMINKQYNCSLPEDEIAYFALHINLSLEQNKHTIQKKNILLVCSSGVGSARLLEYFFKQNFDNYIQRLTVCSRFELKQQNIANYDCVFTTVPIEKLPIPIFLIHNFMNSKDKIRINQNFKELSQTNIMKYFPKKLFFTYDSFDTKEQAIHKMVLKCHQNYDLPDNFEQLILEREQLSTSEFNDLIAFPHSHRPVSTTTFVCVALLKKPLLWKTKKIRIILLSSIENKKMKELDDFYRVISTFMSDTSIQWQLLQNPTYEEFQKVIERIEFS